MSEENKRLGTAFSVAVAVHLMAALLISFFGYRFVTRPPEILEVALFSGGGGGAPEEVVEEQEEKSILRSLDDIIDKRLKPEAKKPVVKKTVKQSDKPNPNVSPTQGNATGAEAGTGTGSGGGDGSGTGAGNGAGQGEGTGRGVPVTPPRLVSSVQPKYPSSARNAGIQGVVGVKMLVGVDGKVQEAFVVRSSGNNALDEAALAAVYKWRFSPAKDKFGQKASCYVTQGIKFDLKR
ncbi:MAG: energy transducer TonB [Phascolarctobacterium sp.]